MLTTSRFAFQGGWSFLRGRESAPIEGPDELDKVSVAVLERKLKNNRNRIWNRMSSGLYMSRPVRGVMIPKTVSRQQPLGFPTAGDQVTGQVSS